LAGNHLATDRVWTFTTGAAPDVTPPSVVTTGPAGGATGVGVDGNVTVHLQERAMKDTARVKYVEDEGAHLDRLRRHPHGDDALLRK